MKTFDKIYLKQIFRKFYVNMAVLLIVIGVFILFFKNVILDQSKAVEQSDLINVTNNKNYILASENSEQTGIKAKKISINFSIIVTLTAFVCIGFGIYLLNQPIIIKESKACGTVNYYADLSYRKRVTNYLYVTMDSSQYLKRFRYEQHLAGLKTNSHICFIYHDKQRNPSLAETWIIKLIDH